MKKNHQRKGFTLVELLLYFGLFSILLFVLARLFVSILEVKMESQSVSSVQQDTRYLIARLEYDVARASSISTPSSLGSTTTSLVMVIDGVTNTYSLSNGVFQVTNNQGTIALSSSQTQISNVSFLRLGHNGGKPTIKVRMDVASTTVTDKGRESRSINTTLGLR